MSNIDAIESQIKELEKKRRRIISEEKLNKKLSLPKSSQNAHPLIKNLVVHRRYMGLTQQYVADKLKMTRATVSNVERGTQNISLATFLAWNDLFKYYTISPTLEPLWEQHR